MFYSKHWHHLFVLNNPVIFVMGIQSAPSLSEREPPAAAGCPAQIIAGNNDFFSSLPREREFNIGKYRVWLTHGHNYYVSMGDTLLKEEAILRGVDIVMFGHTHRPVIEIGKTLTAVNPGSLSFPRQEGRRPSYILMELDKNGEAHYHLNFL